MTVQLKDFLSTDKLPTFLSKNKTLLSIDKVDKVFNRIGLPNSKEDCELDNSAFVNASAVALINAFQYVTEDPGCRLSAYNLYYPAKVLSASKSANILYWGKVIRNFAIYLRDTSRTEMISVDDGKVSIKLSKNICDADQIFYDKRLDNTDVGNVIFKKNESLFKVYNKIYKAISELKCGIKIEKLDSMPEFKRFSSDNLPQNNFQIVFSADGLDGLWDIATMSMRGITSCQSWDGQYKNNLVGSIVDPFVGVIYLTSGTSFNGLGSKMIKRSVVRLVVNSEDKKPFILIDRMYPEVDKNVCTSFISFIKKRVGDKLDVVFGPEMGFNKLNKSYIPSSPVHNVLTKVTQSYRDTRVPFKKEIPTVQSLLDKNILSKKSKFKKILTANCFQSTNAYQHALEADCSKIKNKNINSSVESVILSCDFKHLVRKFYTGLATRIIENGPKESDSFSSKEYMRRLCFYYMHNKDSIYKKSRTSFVKELNNYFNFQLDSKLNSKSLDVILNQSENAINSKIKNELRNLLGKKTKNAKLLK